MYISIILLSLAEDENKIIIELYNKYNRLIYNVSHTILQSKEDSEDIVISIFTKLIENIDIIKNMEDSKILPFFIVVARNASINLVRQNNKIDKHNDFESLNITYSKDDFTIKCDSIDLEKYLSELSQDDQIILHLRFLKDLPYSDISQLLGISESAARKRTERAIIKLRKHYNKDSD